MELWLFSGFVKVTLNLVIAWSWHVQSLYHFVSISLSNCFVSIFSFNVTRLCMTWIHWVISLRSNCWSFCFIFVKHLTCCLFDYKSWNSLNRVDGIGRRAWEVIFWLSFFNIVGVSLVFFLLLQSVAKFASENTFGLILVVSHSSGIVSLRSWQSCTFQYIAIG